MPIKTHINGETFDLAPEILEGILDAIEKTAKDGNEHGFLMCDTPKGITLGKKCTGDKCSINLTNCEPNPIIGGFHSHPIATSFSQSDYLNAFKKAKEHPEHKHLLCVSLLDKGIRCKALKELPPPDKKFPIWDTDENREMVKPYFTKRVNISLEQINELLKGTPWGELPPAEPVIAIDEGEGVKVVPIKEMCPTPKSFEELVNELQAAYEQVTAPKFKTEMVKGQLVMVPIPSAEVISPEPIWMNIKDIETPDPTLIAGGEVLGYAKGMSPVLLLEEKVDGKWKIHDGRHRLTAFLTAGYDKAPVVFVKP